LKPPPLTGDFMAIEQELLDNLFANYNYQKPDDLIGENGLLKQLTNRALKNVEITRQ
jgi:hypothetical protein